MSDPAARLSEKLPAETARTLTVLCDALIRIVGANLRSICVYGSAVRGDFRPGKSDINLLIVAERVDVPLMKSLLEPIDAARLQGVVPFLLTEENLKSSTDVFPGKFLSMQEAYVVLHGQDLLAGLAVGREHLRLRCEQEVKNLLLRLRRHYLTRNGRGLTEMMARSIGGLLETLRVGVSLLGGQTPARGEVAQAAAGAFGIDAELLRRVLSLRDRVQTLPPEESGPLYDRYMAAVERIARVMDAAE